MSDNTEELLAAGVAIQAAQRELQRVQVRSAADVARAREQLSEAVYRRQLMLPDTVLVPVATLRAWAADVEDLGNFTEDGVREAVPGLASNIGAYIPDEADL